jgi:hypothetical protein
LPNAALLWARVPGVRKLEEVLFRFGASGVLKQSMFQWDRDNDVLIIGWWVWADILVYAMKRRRR